MATRMRSNRRSRRAMVAFGPLVAGLPMAACSSSAKGSPEGYNDGTTPSWNDGLRGDRPLSTTPVCFSCPERPRRAYRSSAGWPRPTPSTSSPPADLFARRAVSGTPDWILGAILSTGGSAALCSAIRSAPMTSDPDPPRLSRRPSSRSPAGRHPARRTHGPACRSDPSTSSSQHRGRNRYGRTAQQLRRIVGIGGSSAKGDPHPVQRPARANH